MRINVPMGIALLGVLAAAGAATADTVTPATLSGTFNTVSPYSSVDVSRDGGVNWAADRAGQMNWTRTGGNYTGLGGANNSGFQFSSFCVELTQNVHYNTGADYTVVDVNQVPSPGSPDVGVGMGVGKSLQLRELWGLFRDGIQSNDSIGAAAFQLAVWEVVYDDDTSLSNGSFRARVDSPVSIQAQSWLNQLDGTHALPTLYGMSSPTAQDQVFFEEPPSLPPASGVPLPSAFWAGGVLLAGLIVRRIRRYRNSRA